MEGYIKTTRNDSFSTHYVIIITSAMRALILNKPENVYLDTEKWISQSSCETNCLCFDIGDKSRYKVKCYVAYDSNDEEEMQFAQILGADMEILFAGASAQKIGGFHIFRDYCRTLALLY